MCYVYHYTTDQGLKGILESGEIWAKSIYHFFKDPQEFYLGRDRFIEITKTLLTGEEAEAARDMVLVLNQSQPSMFVCSFTDADDSAYHWQEYCRNDGYAIGFPVAELMNHVHSLPLGL